MACWGHFGLSSPFTVSSILVLLFTLMESGLKHRAGGHRHKGNQVGEVKDSGPGKQGKHREGSKGFVGKGGVWMGCKGRILWPPSCLRNNQGSSATLETLRTVKGSLSGTQVLASSFLAPFLTQLAVGLCPFSKPAGGTTALAPAPRRPLSELEQTGMVVVTLTPPSSPRPPASTHCHSGSCPDPG